MGLVRTRYSSLEIATQASHFVDRAGSGKPKWCPLNFGYYDETHAGPTDTVILGWYLHSLARPHGDRVLSADFRHRCVDDSHFSFG